MIDQIDNIIYDLGNVIIRLDIEATDNAFKNLFQKDYDRILEELNEAEVFHNYEKGNISSNEFFNEIQLKAPQVAIEELKNAWNAMLLDIPESRYDLLERTKKTHRTFCLSNTNETHIDFIYEMLEKTKGIPNLNQYFEKVYLSHEIHMRKPDVEIFEKVIADNNLDPSRTLFIDDTTGHLEGAKKAGIKVLHLTSFQLLENYLY